MDLRLGGLSEWITFRPSFAGDHDRTRNGINGQYDRRFGEFTGTVGFRGDVTNDFGFHPGFTAG
jgi:iron complex outermembrane receptor protein